MEVEFAGVAPKAKAKGKSKSKAKKKQEDKAQDQADQEHDHDTKKRGAGARTVNVLVRSCFTNDPFYLFPKQILAQDDLCSLQCRVI